MRSGSACLGTPLRPVVDHLLNRLGEFVHDERFHHKRIHTQCPGLLRVDDMAKTRTENDGDVRSNAPKFPDQHFARHVGHGLIGDDEIEPLRCGAECFQGLSAIPQAHDLIAKPPEECLLNTLQRLFVIDQENAAVLDKLS